MTPSPAPANVDILIVGAGLAGAAAAITLARAGRSVTLIEREPAAQHKVCGEFLSREALGYLRALGLDVTTLGAVPIDRVRLIRDGAASEARLPFEGMSVTRRRLDEALLSLAAPAGAHVRRGCNVESVHPVAEGWRALLPAQEALHACTLIVASGKHDLRGHPRAAGRQNDLVAFKMYWRLAAPQAAQLHRHVELLLYPGGYAGLQPVEDGLANLCCLVRRDTLRQLGGNWNALLSHMQAACPHLRTRLLHAQPMLPKPLAISTIPYGFVRRSTDGAWWLGDQAAVIPSFTGDGMSIALHTAHVASQMYLQGAPAAAFQSRIHAELARQVRVSTLLSQAVIAQPGLLATAARLWPGALRVIARQTRIGSKFLAA